MMKIYALMTLMFIGSVDTKPPILYEIERAGVIRWQGECILARTLYYCVVVSHHDDEYILAGRMLSKNYEIHHIFKATGDDNGIIWSHTWVEA